MKLIKSYNINRINALWLEREAAIEGVSASVKLDNILTKLRKKGLKMPLVSKAFLKGKE